MQIVVLQRWKFGSHGDLKNEGLTDIVSGLKEPNKICSTQKSSTFTMNTSSKWNDRSEAECDWNDYEYQQYEWFYQQITLIPYESISN